MHKYPYRERLGPEDGAGSGNYNYLRTEKVKPGVQRRITRCAWSSESSTTSQAVLSIQGHGYSHVFDADYTITADNWNVCREEIVLGDGEQLEVALKDTPSGSNVEAHVTGYEEDVPGYGRGPRRGEPNGQ